MLVSLLLSAGLTSSGPPAFGPAVTDVDLAACAALAVAPTLAPLIQLPASAPLQEQIDDWWAEDGATLLAAARPLPAVPTGLNLSALGTGRLALHLNITVTASTR